MKRNAKIGPTTETLCWKNLRFFFSTAIFPNSVGKTRKQFLKRLQSKRPVSYLLSFWRRWRTIDFLKRLLWNGETWVLVKNKCRGASFGFGVFFAGSALGLTRFANMLWRGLHLRSALGSPASRIRQEFNESSWYRESSLLLHKITMFLWDQAVRKPKPKGNVSKPVMISIINCAVHKTYQTPDPQPRKSLTPCRVLRSNTLWQRCGWGYRSFSSCSYTRQADYHDWTQP